MKNKEQLPRSYC